MAKSVMDKLIEVNRQCHAQVEFAMQAIVDDEYVDALENMRLCRAYLNRQHEALVQYKALGDLMHYVAEGRDLPPGSPFGDKEPN